MAKRSPPATPAPSPYPMRPIASLKLDGANPREITPRALAALVASIRRFGMVVPVVLNRRTGLVVGGHQRIAALLQLGLTEVPVFEGDWSPADARVLNVMLNAREAQGDFTDPAAYLDDCLTGLSLTDFRELGLEDMLAGAAPKGKRAGGKAPRTGLIYKVIVTCADEHAQAALMERLEAEGMDCSPMIA